jgi:Glycosyltransferase family 87
LGRSILPPGKESTESHSKQSGADARAVAESPRPQNSFVRKYGVFCLLGFAVLNGWIFWNLRNSIVQGYGDFASFYPAAQVVREGQSARLYDPGLQREMQQQFPLSVRKRRGPLPYIRPPFEALLFVPLTYVKYPLACLLWTGINVILLLLVAGILSKIQGEGPGAPGYGFIALVTFAFFPVAFDLIVGQDSILLLLILAVGLGLLLRGKEFKCGAVLALGLFKFHLMIPLLAIFALRKKGRLVLGSAAVAGMLLAISWMMVGSAGIWAYPRYLWRLNRDPELGMVNVQNMPNIRGLISLFLGAGSFPAAAHWFLGGMVVLGIIIASRSWRGQERNSIIAAYCFSIVITLATSYYANSYDLTLLLLPLVLLGNGCWLRNGIDGWPRMLFLGSAACLLFTPLLWALSLRTNQFRWAAVGLLGLAVSIGTAEKYGRRVAEA